MTPEDAREFPSPEEAERWLGGAERRLEGLSDADAAFVCRLADAYTVVVEVAKRLGDGWYPDEAYAHSAADHVMTLEDGLASVTRERDEARAMVQEERDRRIALLGDALDQRDAMARERDALREAAVEAIHMTRLGYRPVWDEQRGPEWQAGKPGTAGGFGVRGMHPAMVEVVVAVVAALAPTESEGRQEGA